jgi:hypothetical protein
MLATMVGTLALQEQDRALAPEGGITYNYYCRQKVG